MDQEMYIVSTVAVTPAERFNALDGSERDQFGRSQRCAKFKAILEECDTHKK